MSLQMSCHLVPRLVYWCLEVRVDRSVECKPAFEGGGKEEWLPAPPFQLPYKDGGCLIVVFIHAMAC